MSCRWCLKSNKQHTEDCPNYGEIDNSWTDHKTHGVNKRLRLRECQGRYLKEKQRVGVLSYDCVNHRHEECDGRVDYNKCVCVCHGIFGKIETERIFNE